MVAIRAKAAECNANALRTLLSTTAPLALITGAFLAFVAPAAAQVITVGAGQTEDVSGRVETSNDVSTVLVENGGSIIGGGNVPGGGFNFLMNVPSTTNITDYSACGQAGALMRCTVIVRNTSTADLDRGLIRASHEGTGLATALWVGENATFIGNEVSITGNNAYGVVATLGGSVTLVGNGFDSGLIQTNGNGAHGIFAQAVPATGAPVSIPTSVSASLIAVNTTGDNAVGVMVDSRDGTGGNTLTETQSATANLNSIGIGTAGLNAHGLGAIGTFSQIIVNEGEIYSAGDGASAAFANSGAEIFLTNLEGATAGADAAALLAVGSGSDAQGSYIATNGVRVFTLGAGSYGASATLGGRVELTGTQVLTANDSASGAFAGRNGTIVLSDSLVLTGVSIGSANAFYEPLDTNGNPATTIDAVAPSGNGLAAHGLHVVDSGSIGVLNSTVRTMGDNSAAIFAGFEAGGTSLVSVQGGSLVSDLSDLIRAEDGDLVVILNSVADTRNLNGNVVNAINSQIDATFGVTDGLVGDVVADATSTVNISLLSNSQLLGASLGANNWTVDGTSRWLIDDNSNVRNLTRNAGLIAFTAPAGGTFKQLTTQYYDGNNGLLGLNTYLGDDASQTDILVVTADTSGTTGVVISNAGGPGAQTTGDGIMVVRVDGNSDGQFALAAPVVAGAYNYGLFQGGLADPNDGDWYLRSAGYNPTTTEYESYPQTLLALGALNSLPTFQQRVGNRYWYEPAEPTETIFCKDPAKNFRCEVTQDQASYYEGDTGRPHIDESALWGRIEGSRGHFVPDVSTVGAGYDLDLLKAQIGMDGALMESDAGRLIGGINAYYGLINAEIFSGIDSGNINTSGYGIGATLTWMGENGFYLDSQAQVSWFGSDLTSATLGTLVENNNGMGYAASIEAGQKLALGDHWSITPQAQLVYSKVDFDSFTDTYGATVSLDNGDSLRGRLGLAAEYQESWKGEDGDVQRLHVHGIANLHYEFLNGTQVDVSGVKFNSQNDRLWGGLGVGATYSWDDDKFALYGEINVNTSLVNFGQSNSIGGTAGFRVKW